MIKLIMVWGESDAKRASDEDWKGVENKPSVYLFATEKLKNAFMYGVNEASGWMDYLELTEEEYKNCLTAIKRRGKR